MPAHYLLVDGYNVIYANKELTMIAGDSLDMARKKLSDALCEFKALSRYRIILVFDAHLVVGGEGSIEDYHNIKIIFTKEAETADHYIESVAYKLGKKKDRITVATSDTTEQIIALGQGAGRISAEDLWAEIEAVKEEVRSRYIQSRPVKKNPIESFLDAKTAQMLEEMRYGGTKK